MIMHLTFAHDYTCRSTRIVPKREQSMMQQMTDEIHIMNLEQE